MAVKSVSSPFSTNRHSTVMPCLSHWMKPSPSTADANTGLCIGHVKILLSFCMLSCFTVLNQMSMVSLYKKYLYLNFFKQLVSSRLCMGQSNSDSSMAFHFEIYSWLHQSISGLIYAQLNSALFIKHFERQHGRPKNLIPFFSELSWLICILSVFPSHLLHSRRRKKTFSCPGKIFPSMPCWLSSPWWCISGSSRPSIFGEPSRWV